jgi:hypothetical protein
VSSECAPDTEKTITCVSQGTDPRQIDGAKAASSDFKPPQASTQPGKGTDIAPLLKGLQHDACQAPHWGYVISGDLVVSYTDGTADRCLGGDVFHWPAGHSVRVVEDAEVVLFSPQVEHLHVMGHMAEKLGIA